MKTIWQYLIVFSLISVNLCAQETPFLITDSNVQLNQILKNEKQRKTEYDKLRLAKLSLVNGNLERAKVILINTHFELKESNLIKARYLAMIYFLQENYRLSLETINNSFLNLSSNYPHICILKTINEIALDRKKESKETWDRCNSLTEYYSPTDNFWSKVIFTKSLEKKVNTDQIFKKGAVLNSNLDDLKIYLKLALYLNKAEIILPFIDGFSQEVYDHPQLRELIGLLYYKNLNFVETYNFIEDLSTPNAENVKGNFYLAQKNYELAYGQFKLALMRKQNSVNALTRIIPLAWTLGQWKDGINYVEQIQPKSNDERTKLKALKASFEAMDNNFDAAQKTLEETLKLSRFSFNKEIASLYSYVTTEKGNINTTILYSNHSCKEYDAVNCWYLFQMTRWENFPQTLKREDKIIEKHEDKLAYFISGSHEKFQEREYINQKDIEDLDEKLINLTKN